MKTYNRFELLIEDEGQNGKVSKLLRDRRTGQVVLYMSKTGK